VFRPTALTVVCPIVYLRTGPHRKSWVDFHEILGIGIIWTREGTIKFSKLELGFGVRVPVMVRVSVSNYRRYGNHVRCIY